MPKIEVSQVVELIKSHEIEPETLRQIIEEINEAVEPEVDEEKAPPIKKQFAVLVSDPEGRLPEDAEFVAWVLQLPEEAAVITTEERIHRAAYEFNATRKGRLNPIKTVGEACENIPAKHLKEQQVWVKTKTPVFMLRTNNHIPTETKE